MVYNCELDNKSIKVRDGFTIKEEFNETLDSGTFQFFNKDGVSPIEPFDSVVFESELIPHFKRKKQLVDTYSCEIVKFNDTLENSSYFYQVNIFSETKCLERITLPNLSITKRPDGTIVSVWTKIKQYCKKYLPYVRVYDEGNSTLVPCYKYDESMETKFSMECPEFTWNTPTLKEVLTDLMSVADCIPVVKDNVLTYFDLTQKGNEIDTSKLSNVQYSGTSADYCDSLTLPVKNIISKQPVIVKERLLPRSQSGELDTNNASFITRKPIYNIKSAYLYLRITYSVEHSHDTVHLFKLDITDLIVEKNTFEKLSNKRSLPLNLNDLTKNKCCNLWYERGSNTINNISVTYKRSTQTRTTFTYIGLVRSGIPAEYNPDVNTSDFNPFIELEYETIDETTISIDRKNPLKNAQNSLFDSQSANSVDLDHQMKFEASKINRLGNKIMTIYGEYNDESDVPNLADYIGDYVLYSREVTYYDNQIMFKGELCENYVLRNYFTGVNAKRRSWNIVDASSSVDRIDIYKVFVTFAEQPFAEQHSGLPFVITKPFLSQYFCSFTHPNLTQFGTCLIQTRDEDDNLYPDNSDDTKYGITDMLTYTGESDVIFAFTLSDNASFGDKIEIDDSMHIMDPVFYTDQNGELEYINILLGKTINEEEERGRDINNDLADLITKKGYVPDVYTYVLTDLRKIPIITYDDDSEDNLQFRALINKDNAEKLSSSIHFSYISDSDKIILGKNYPLYVRAGNGAYKGRTVAIKFKANHHYSKFDKLGVGETYAIAYATFGTTPSTYSGFISLSLLMTEKDSWAICDALTNEIIIAVNGLNIVYLNYLYYRDENVYNNQIDRVKIGKIYDSAEDLEDAYDENPAKVETINVLGREIDVEDLKDF